MERKIIQQKISSVPKWKADIRLHNPHFYYRAHSNYVKRQILRKYISANHLL